MPKKPLAEGKSKELFVKGVCPVYAEPVHMEYYVKSIDENIRVTVEKLNAVAIL